MQTRLIYGGRGVLFAAMLLSGCAMHPEKKTSTGDMTPSAPASTAAKAPAEAAKPAPATAGKKAAKAPPGSRESAAKPPRPSPGHACISLLPADRVLVNKQHLLPADDFPDDLVELQVPFIPRQARSRRYMRAEAAQSAQRMFSAAKGAGLELLAVSAFRSYEIQHAVFQRASAKYGSAELANTDTALAGQSEHQSGLAIDVTSSKIGNVLHASFGETPEGRWLSANAARFGFILRYPQGKEGVTGYRYEPWHWRYVGRQAAQVIAAGSITLEEYLQGSSMTRVNYLRDGRCSASST